MNEEKIKYESLKSTADGERARWWIDLLECFLFILCCIWKLSFEDSSFLMLIHSLLNPFIQARPDGSSVKVGRWRYVVECGLWLSCTGGVKQWVQGVV